MLHHCLDRKPATSTQYLHTAACCLRSDFIVKVVAGSPGYFRRFDASPHDAGPLTAALLQGVTLLLSNGGGEGRRTEPD